MVSKSSKNEANPIVGFLDKHVDMKRVDAALGPRANLKKTGIVAALIAAWVLSVPEWRWNILLFVYMPTMSGYLFEWSFLQPALQSYLDFELWLNPHLFVAHEPREMYAGTYSWSEFMSVSEGSRYPIVVRGLFNGTRAVETFGTDDWVASHSEFKFLEIVDNGNFKYEYDLVEKDTFTDYVKAIKRGESRYHNGLDEVVSRYPDLVKDMELGRLGNTYENFCRSLSLFVTGDAKGLKWHNSDHANIAMVYHGQKTWTFVDPKYSLFLAPEFSWDPYATGLVSKAPSSTFEKLPTFSITFGPGDAMFNPVWSWHTVSNTADPVTKLVVMSTCRYSSIKNALVRVPAFELYRHLGQYNWIQPSLPPVLRWVPYFRVLQDSVREALGWVPRWGHGYVDDCFSSKRSACDRYFKRIGLITGNTSYVK